jgi:hypothetical protein
MKAILFVILIAFLLIGVNADDTFTGFRISLTKKHLVELGKGLVVEMLNTFKDLEQEPMITVNKIGLFTLALVTTNIKTEFKSTLESEESSLADTTFKVSYSNPFALNFIFNYDVTILGAHIDNGIGNVTVLGKYICVKQDFGVLDPKTEIEVDFVVDSVKVNKGIYSEGISRTITTQFKDIMIERVKAVFDAYSAEAYILSDHEYFYTILKSQDIATFTRTELVQSLQDNETKHLVRVTNATMAINEEPLNSGEACTYKRQVDPTKSELCFCKHLFPWVLVNNSFMESLNLSNWGLKGRIVELYELAPEVIHLFSADEPYEIIITPYLIEANEAHKDRLYLVKHFSFNMYFGSIFELLVTFSMKLEGKYDKEKGVLDIIQKDVKIEKIIGSNEELDIAGSIVLSRYIDIEAELMKESKLIPEGLKIPFEDPIVAEYNDGFCVQA